MNGTRKASEKENALELLAMLTIVGGVKRNTPPEYGKTYGARLKGKPAAQIEALAKSKSTKANAVRPSDIVRAAVMEYLAKHAAAARSAA